MMMDQEEYVVSTKVYMDLSKLHAVGTLFTNSCGLEKCKEDPCLFIKKEEANKLLVALYLDDGLKALIDLEC